MAQYTNNIVTQRLSGKVGDLVVFRQLRGKTILASRPSKPKSESKTQKENRSLFKDASRYAKHCMLNPEKKEYFQNIAVRMGWPNAYTAALTKRYRELKGLGPIMLPAERSNNQMSTYTLKALLLLCLKFIFTVASAIASTCAILQEHANKKINAPKRRLPGRKILSID